MSANMGKADVRIDWATHAAAKYACETWHYSGCLPAGKLVKVGAWERGRFIGVVLFGRGANNAMAAAYKLGQDEACELVRVALTDHETPVSRIMALAVRFLRRISPGLRLVVSYADPKQGHHGGIYQACGWVYDGTSRPQRALIINGKPVHKRAASSIYGTASPAAIRYKTGADVQWSSVEWKHRYLMPLDDGMRARVLPLSKPYPKRQPVGGSGDQPDERPCESDPGAPSSEKPDAPA